MKLTILKNTPIDISADCQKVVDFFKSYFPLEFSFQNTSVPVAIKPYLTRPGFSPQTGQPVTVTYFGVSNIPNNPDTVFCWDMDFVQVPPNSVITSFTSGAFIQLAINQYAKTQDNIWKKLSHEILHLLCYRANQAGFNVMDEMDLTTTGIAFAENDNPSSLTGNYARTLKNLQPYLNSLTATEPYTFFSQVEVNQWKLKPELFLLLDKARGIAGVPFKITSGFRTPQQNAQVGGVANSAHLTGEACDVACSDSQGRLKMVSAFLKVGFTRIEIATQHIHVDISKTLPQNVMVLSENS